MRSLLLLLPLLAPACQEYDLAQQPDDVDDPQDPVEDPPSGPQHMDEVFDVEGETRPVDILLFGDTSGSMSDELTTMGNAIDAFVAQLNLYTQDWQLMVTTGFPGCTTSGVLRPTMSDYVQRFKYGLTVGPSLGRWDESGIVTVKSALELTPTGECNAGFMRQDAMLHVIFLSDENDESPGAWGDYLQEMVALKGSQDLIRFSAIIGDIPDGCTSATNQADPGWGYFDLVWATGGQLLSICSDWGANVDVLADASVLRETFALEKTPVPETIVVTVDGVDRAGDWTYDPTQNAVVFQRNAPAGGMVVEITYDVAE